MMILTEKELAGKLGLSQNTIRNWRLKLGLPYFGTPGRIFYRWESVETWMSEQEARNAIRHVEELETVNRIIA